MFDGVNESETKIENAFNHLVMFNGESSSIHFLIILSKDTLCFEGHKV